jgi:F-type H+-transporting ATPase subunit delta
MRGTRAAIRYAKATLAFAQEAKASDRVAEDMLAIGTLMQQNDELQIVLENPILPVAQKEAALKSLFSNACPQTIQLFSLLAENNRLAIVATTAQQYVRLYAQTQGETTAIVTTAAPLSPALEKLVLEKAKSLTQDKVQLENKVDSSIIGGFILQIGDMQYDASVVHQLKAIKTTLTKTNTI